MTRKVKKYQSQKVHFNGLKNILKIIDIKNLKLFIQVGSSLEYGKRKSPQKESFFCKPISHYGKAKYDASNLLKKKLKKFVILRPYQIYGPNQKTNRLIPMVINSCLKDETFSCTSGNQLRDFLYVDDFSHLIIKILKRKFFQHRIYNVGNGSPKKVKDVITVKVISTDNKGLIVRPEECELDFLIKKSNIALNTSDARPSRFVGGERIDAAIAEINMEKRKVSLSIKLLEELQNREAVTKFSSPLSGKNLPFSSLSEKLEDKKKDDK